MKLFTLTLILFMSATHALAEKKAGWSYSNGNGKGEFCSATFAYGTDMVMLRGPGGEYQNTMMTFASPKIPSPNTPKKIAVSLKQGTDSPQKVNVINHKEKNLPHGYGAITFLIPSVEALLDNIEESQYLEVSIEGRTVATIQWNEGLVARDRLKECLY